MKILNTQTVKTLVLDQTNKSQFEEVVRRTNKILLNLNLGELTPDTIIYIPYKLWIVNGGSGNIVPNGVKLVHGLDKPTTDLLSARVVKRQLFVTDKASSTGLAPRIHFASNYRDPQGNIRINTDQAYCGEHGAAETVSPSLDSVTCPECLMELKRINQSH